MPHRTFATVTGRLRIAGLRAAVSQNAIAQVACARDIQRREHRKLRLGRRSALAEKRLSAHLMRADLSHMTLGEIE